MKIFGYADDGLPNDEDVVPKTLAEITLCASPDELRRMAAFLKLCAKEMERTGPKFSHIHLSDRMKEFESSPHFVVTPPD